MYDELLDLETNGWNALSSPDSGAAHRVYAELLREDAIMLFPGGLVLSGRQRILDSLAAQPWQEFELQNAAVVSLGGHAAALTYKVAARREGGPVYEALVSSTYVQENGRWQLAVHQHTPA